MGACRACLPSKWRCKQGCLPLLNFSNINGKQREAYFVAVRASIGRDYASMIDMFRKVVKASS